MRQWTKQLNFLVTTTFIVSIVMTTHVSTGENALQSPPIPTSASVNYDADSDISLWLHAQGTKMRNSDDEEVVWNGIDTKTLFGYWSYASGGRLEESLHAKDIDFLRSQGLNTVRVDISLNSAVYNPEHVDNPPPEMTPTNLVYYPRFWELLDELVNASAKAGMWIKINYGHSDGTWANLGGAWGEGNGLPRWMYDGSWTDYFTKTYPNDGTGWTDAMRDFWNINDGTASNVRIAFQTFWKDIVTRYKDNSNVVFSLFNEPQNQWGGGTTPIWGAPGYPTQEEGAVMYRDFMEQTIDILRAIDNGRHLIVIQNAYFWDRASNLKVDRPNIIVEDHAYNIISQSFVNYGWRYNQPFILGEFGGIEQGLQDRTSTIANMQFCNSLNASWMYLNYDTTRGYPSEQTWIDLRNNLDSNLKYY